MARPLRAVSTSLVRGGGSTLSPGMKFHWWELHLECGHVVERRIRWTPVANPNRGWAAQHHGVSLTRLPAAPTRARCEFCRAA